MSRLVDFWSTYGSQILPALGQHLILVGVALASGIIVAVPLGIILTRLKKDSVFSDFVSDALEESGIGLIRLDTEALKQIPVVRRKFRLDFDDAYQYLAAEKYSLTLVSFDSDFDHTERGRKTPVEVRGPQ